MKYFIPSLLILLSSAVHLQAQTLEIKIVTTVAKGDTIPPATIQLFHLPDSSLVSTQVARIGGNQFSVAGLSKYILKISSSGYATIDRTINVVDKAVTVQADLKKAIKGLDEVVIVSRKALMRQEDDKTIVDAEPLVSSSSNAYEILEKTPGAIIDQDGNVYLSSMTPATIQINGREVKLSATDLASLLKSLPAGSVSKIEILRSPSAKYDAASSGGIVNIVLKKGVKIGASGSMNAGWFQGVHSTKFAGFNLNKGGAKGNAYLSYQLTERNYFEDLNSTRQLTTSSSVLQQNAHTTYPSTNQYFGAGTDLSLSKKFSLAYDLRISATDNRSNALNQIDIVQQQNQAITGTNASTINNKSNSLYAGNNLSTKLKIDSAGSEWTTQIDFNLFRYSGEQVYRNNYYLPAQATLFGNGDNSNRKYIFTVQSDLVWKLPHAITAETGFKTTVANSNNSALYFIQQGATPVKTDEFQTNQFRYHERITSAYLQLSKTFFGFTVKPGIRLEATDISGRQIIPADTSLAINRSDLFPYLYLRHRIMKLFGFELNGNAIIRRSITRPYYEVLNQYPKYIDQYLFDVGNPRLQPQFTTNYEFNITANEFTIFSVGVNETSNIFSNVTYQDDATGIAYRTYDNLGKNKEVYLRMVGGIPPGGKYFFYAGAQQNINTYDGFYQGSPLQYTRSSWVFFMYQQLKLTPTLTVSANGFMRLKGLQNFYELNNFGALNFTLNQSILKKTANLVLSFNDVLLTNKNTFKLQQGNVSASGNRLNDTRRIGLTFRYNFGIKPKEEKKAMFEQPAETKE